MFFIGGINSVLPYILYLTLVWMFVFIGHAHVAKDVLKQKDIPLNKVQALEVCQPEPFVLLVSDQSIPSSTRTRNKVCFQGPPGIIEPALKLVRRHTPVHPVMLKPSFYTSIFAYRGPPLA